MTEKLFRYIIKSLPYFTLPFLVACISTSNNSPKLSSNQLPVRKTGESAPDLRLKSVQRIADLPAAKGSQYGIDCINEQRCWLYDSIRLWESSDGGRTWNLIYTLGEKESRIGYDFINERMGWSYSASAVFKTVDGGRTWAQQPTPLDSLNGEIRSLHFNENETGWLAGGIFRPKTKEESKYGVPNNTKDVTGEKVLEDAILRSNNGGATWHQQSLSPRWVGRILGLRFLDEIHGLAAGEIVYYTDNGGKTWRRPDFRKSCTRTKYLDDYYEGRPAAIAMLDSKLWWLSFNDGRVLKSNDGGRSWCDLVHPDEIQFAGPGLPAYFTSMEFVSPERGWGLGFDNFLYETKDGGRSWIRVSSDIKFDSIFSLHRKSLLLVSKQGLFRLE